MIISSEGPRLKMNDVLSFEEIDDLVLLARGDVDLVADALAANMRLEGGWFRKSQWVIDKEATINYIKDHVKKLEEIPVLGDDDALHS